MEEAVFENIGVYIISRKNTIAQYIATRPILDLCEQSLWRPGAWVSRQWWEQKGLDLEGAEDRASVGWRRGSMRGGSGSGRDVGPGLKVGSTKVVT